MEKQVDARTETALALKALGDPTRLEIYRFLCGRCCPVALDSAGNVRPVIGPTVGEVCCQVTGVERANSRISFHLKELRNAGLITMERRGKTILCGIERARLAEIAAFFVRLQGEQTDECCE